METNNWRTDHSIFESLYANLNEEGGLTEAGKGLPDEEKRADGIGFAPGLMDAMVGADDPTSAQDSIAELLQHLKNVAFKGDERSELAFYRLITETEDVIGIIDGFLEAVVNEALPIAPYLFNYARDLATKTDKRNAVKFGIAILGLCQNKSVLDDIRILGLHDEFTVYAAIAIMNLSDQVEHDLWELAQQVDGWGKIQLVDRLARLELNEPIKEWLINDGYKNYIMYEYLAYTCAIHGDLHEKLEAEIIEHRLFKSASDIIDALLAKGGPAEDITIYPFAAQVVRDFIRHAKTHGSGIADYNVLLKIKDFLIGLQEDMGAQEENGWDQDVISNCIIDLVEILKSDGWKGPSER